MQLAECLGLKKGEAAVDLHGLSGLEARAAVLCVLSSVQQRAAQGESLEPHLTFITGASFIIHHAAFATMHLLARHAARPSPAGCALLL